MMNRTAVALTVAIVAGGACATPSLAQRGRHGPLPTEQRDAIHELARSHDAITREVKLTETGYVAKTTSNDEHIAQLLREHVAYMKERVDSGPMVRRWDPAYREFLAHLENISVRVTERESGLQVSVEGTTPDAVLVAQNHGKIVSAFVERGLEAVQSEHPPALDADREKP